MKGNLFLTLIFVFLGGFACSSSLEGDSEIGGEASGDSSYSESSESSESIYAEEADTGGGETGVSSPMEEGIEIPVTISKVTLPSLDARYLAFTTIPETSSRLKNYFWGIRSAWAESSALHVACTTGCIDTGSLSEGIESIVTIKNNETGLSTTTSLASDGSFEADIPSSLADAAETSTLSFCLADKDNPDSTGHVTEVTIFGVGESGIVLSNFSLTIDDTDKKFIFGSKSDLGVLISEPSQKSVGHISLAGGSLTTLFTYEKPISHPQWQPDGEWFTYLRSDQAVIQYTVATGVTKTAVGKPAPGITRVIELSSDSKWMAISDNDGGARTPIGIFDTSTWEKTNTIRIDADLDTGHEILFTPNGKDLVVIGREKTVQAIKPVPGNTFVFLVSDFSTNPVTTTIYEGDEAIDDWVIPSDSLGFFYITSNNIFYRSFFAGDNAVQLTNSSAERSQLAISGSGKWLAYLFKESGNATNRIFIFSLPDNRETAITDEAVSDYSNPIFTGAENALFYLTKDSDGYSQVYVKNIDTLF